MTQNYPIMLYRRYRWKHTQIYPELVYYDSGKISACEIQLDVESYLNHWPITEFIRLQITEARLKMENHNILCLRYQRKICKLVLCQKSKSTKITLESSSYYVEMNCPHAVFLVSQKVCCQLRYNSYSHERKLFISGSEMYDGSKVRPCQEFFYLGVICFKL